MRMSILLAVFTALVFTATPVLAADQPAVDMAKAKEAFEKACSKCHGIDRPLGKTKDKDGWKATVERMSGYHKDSFGAEISGDDRAAIIEYLLLNAGK